MKSKGNKTDNNHVCYFPVHDPAAWSHNSSRVNLTVEWSVSELIKTSNLNPCRIIIISLKISSNVSCEEKSQTWKIFFQELHFVL